MAKTRTIDMQTYISWVMEGTCFICEMVSGNLAYRHHIVYEDEDAVAFLNKYPMLYGYTLVAPKAHKERVTADFTAAEIRQHM